MTAEGKMHKSERRFRKDVIGFWYRGIGYDVSMLITNTELCRNYYCAYFYLHTGTIDINLKLQEEVEIDYTDFPLSFFSSSRFLGSKTIDEIEQVAHFAFTFAEIECVTSHIEGKIVSREFLKLGVDYNHLGDEDAGHCVESVCKDCEKVIDKIHDMGIFKGDANA